MTSQTGTTQENSREKEACQVPASGDRKPLALAGVAVQGPPSGPELGASPSLDTWDQVGIFRKTLVKALELCGREGEAEAVGRCGEDFKVGCCLDCGAVAAFPLSCDHRLCPKCAARRGTRLVLEHRDILVRLHYPKMLTLTFLSVKKLDRHFIKWARGCFTKLRHRQIFKSCWGGIYSFEATHTDQGWHLHIHALLGSARIDQGELSRVWEQISGAVVVDIRSVKGKDKWGAVKEVVKYPAKAATFLGSPDLVNEFLLATAGVNLAYGFGAMYRVKTRRHCEAKMRCPLCGGNDISWAGGFGFCVPKIAVQRVKGGWLWRPPPGSAWGGEN